MSFLIQLLYYCALSVATIFLGIYFYFRYSYSYWARKGVPYIEPKFPLGNNDCLGYKAFSYGIESHEWYKELRKRNLKFGGAWSWAKPLLVVTDPDYIKDVLVKDFDYFTDRDFYSDPNFNKENGSIFTAKGKSWRNIRHKLTPTFTSAKMKMMFPTVDKCSGPLIECFERASRTGKDLNIIELSAAFTIDVIGCIAFGIEFDSFKNEDAKFRRYGLDFFKVDFKRAIKILFTRIFEDTAKKLGVGNIPPDITMGLVTMAMETIDYRRKNNITRPDYTQLLIDLVESTKDLENPFTITDLTANAVSFFIAGFDTSSSTIQFALYELARHPDLQEKARTEVQTILKKHNGELTYEAYQEMMYLRQVIDETLRMYQPVYALTREAIKPYTFKESNFTIEKGKTVVIPVVGLHKDPEYFPDPERFDPDRFTAENKAGRNPYVYMPFSEGPRNCIGMRFGLMVVSIGLINVLRKFKISISSRTKMPLTLERGTFLIAPKEILFLTAEEL